MKACRCLCKLNLCVTLKSVFLMLWIFYVKVGAGRQWYIQVLYTIQESPRRIRRSTNDERRGENGSNVAKITLHNNDEFDTKWSHPDATQSIEPVANEKMDSDRKSNAQQTPNAQINNNGYAIEKHLPYTVAILCTLAFLFIICLTVFIRYKRKLILSTKNMDASTKNSPRCTSAEHVDPQQQYEMVDTQVQLWYLYNEIIKKLCNIICLGK